MLCSRCDKPIPPGQEETHDMPGASGAGASVYLHRGACPEPSLPPRRYPVTLTEHPADATP